ncbi:S-adenosyl-L-methionine-dependent methyltransferase [Naviculisporaceae sp. PSN 640]
MAEPTIEAGRPEDIEVDEFEPKDIDGSSFADSTSVASSIYQHSYENGRRYHAYKNARYPIPNDDLEQNREDMKHAMMMELTNGKLFFAPIESPTKIIDLGTGTGIWAIEAADQYPSAEVLGVDFTPIQPTWVPQNLKFIVDDIEQDWAYGEQFDLVHLRQIFPVLKNPAKVLEQAFTTLEPGGWIEIQEFGGTAYCDDSSVPKEYSVHTFLDLCQEALSKFGSNFRIGNQLEEPLTKAGFINVSAKKLKVPIGTWPRDKRLRLVGLYFKTILAQLVAPMAAKPFPALGLSKEEIDALVAKVEKDLNNSSYHAYFEYIFWTGQKPE